MLHCFTLRKKCRRRLLCVNYTWLRLALLSSWGMWEHSIAPLFIGVKSMVVWREFRAIHTVTITMDLGHLTIKCAIRHISLVFIMYMIMPIKTQIDSFKNHSTAESCWREIWHHDHRRRRSLAMLNPALWAVSLLHGLSRRQARHLLLIYLHFRRCLIR